MESRVLKAIQGWDKFPSEKSSELSLDVSFEDMGFDSLDKVIFVIFFHSLKVTTILRMNGINFIKENFLNYRKFQEDFFIHNALY